MLTRVILVGRCVASHQWVAVSLQLRQGKVIFVFVVNRMMVNHSALHILHGKNGALTKIVMVMAGEFESLGYACPK